MTQVDPMEKEHGHFVEAQHRAAGCFHALLSLLQKPLATAVKTACAIGLKSTPEYESSRYEYLHDGLSKVGLRMRLFFIRDEWELYFKEAPFEWMNDLRVDVDVVLDVQKDAFETAEVEVKSYEKAIAAVLRLLEAVRVDEETQRQCQALQAMILRGSTSHEVIGEISPEQHTVEQVNATVKTENEGLTSCDNVTKASPTTPHDGEISVVSSPSDIDCYMSSSVKATSLEPTTEANVEAQAVPDDSINGGFGVAKRTVKGTIHGPKDLRTARNHIEKREFGHALVLISKGLSRKKTSKSTRAKLLVIRAQCSFELKHYLRVHDDCLEALAIDKTLVEAYYWATLALDKLGRRSEAQAMSHAGLTLRVSDTKLNVLEQDISPKALDVSKAKMANNSDAASPSANTSTLSTAEGRGKPGNLLMSALATLIVSQESSAVQVRDTSDAIQGSDTTVVQAAALVHMNVDAEEQVTASTDVGQTVAVERPSEEDTSLVSEALDDDRNVSATVGKDLSEQVNRTGHELDTNTTRRPDEGDPMAKDLQAPLVVPIGHASHHKEGSVVINDKTPAKKASKELRTARTCIDERDFGHAVFWVNKEIDRTKPNTQAHAQLLVLRARCRFELKQHVSVHDDCKKALAIDKKLVEAYQWATLALMELDRLSEAHSMCSAGLKIHASNTNLKASEKKITRMAIAAFKAKKAASITSATSASNSDVGSSPLSTDRTEATKSLTPVPFPTPSDPVSFLKTASADGQKLIEKRDIEAAVALFTTALKLLDASNQAKRVKFLGHRARCLLELQQYEHAVVDAREGLKLKADWLEGHRLICKALIGLERWQEAHAECKIVLGEAPQDVIFQNVQRHITAKTVALPRSVAPTSTSNTESERASAMTKDTETLVISQFETLSRRAIEHLKVKEYGAAASCCTESIALVQKPPLSTLLASSKKSSVFINRARCWVATKKFEAALEDARTGLTHNPDWAEAHRLVCVALMGLDRWRDALSSCEQVLQRVPADTTFKAYSVTIRAKLQEFTLLSPPSPASTISEDLMKTLRQLNAEGVALRASRNLEAAETKLTAAIALLGDTRKKKSASFFGERARCRLVMKKFHEALSDARESLACDPKWMEGNRLQCRAFMGLGQWAEASRMCGRVLTAAPQDVAFQTIKKQIDDALRGEVVGEVIEKHAHNPAPGAPKSSPPLPSAPQASSSPYRVIGKEILTTPQQLRIEGRALMMSRDLEAAERKFSDAIALLGDDRSDCYRPRYFEDRARCRMEMEKFHDAISDAREALACAPGWIEGDRILCRAFMRLGQWHEASEPCSRVLYAVPQDMDFRSIKAEVELMVQREEQHVSEEPSAEDTASFVHEDEGPATTEVVSVDNSQTMKTADDSARIRELESFAAGGSTVVKRYLSAQTYLEDAKTCLREGDVSSAFSSCRRALKWWPQLEILSDIADDLRTVGSHDAIAWGGPMLYFHLQAATMTFDTYSAEREYWKQRLERYPQDSQLHATFALVLYRRHETNAALQHAEEALRIDQSETTDTTSASGITTQCRYLRAVCTPIETTSSTTSWLTNVFTSQGEPRTRASELLKYIEEADVDEEWMPHACYSLGVLHLNKCEYDESAKFCELAIQAEKRRSKVRLFPEIDGHEFHDKTKLTAAVGELRKELSSLADLPMTCAWCRETIPMDAYFNHKLESCVSRPILLVEVGKN